MKKKLTPEEIYFRIQRHWKDWAKTIKAEKFVVGISGGKDSTVVAYLAAKLFGPENVIGVLLPCDGQKDISDSLEVVNNLKIKNFCIDIGNSVHSILNSMDNNTIDISKDTKINLPCRIRMATLYAVAQSFNAIVLNTSNLTEDTLGYATLWGDTCGSYAPIQGLTVTEVITLGDYLGVPYHLSHKVPVDGLQELTDEEKLGMTYAEVDNYIRDGIATPELKDKILKMYWKNYFKIDMIKLPGPKFHDMPNYVTDLELDVGAD